MACAFSSALSVVCKLERCASVWLGVKWLPLTSCFTLTHAQMHTHTHTCIMMVALVTTSSTSLPHFSKAHLSHSFTFYIVGIAANFGHTYQALHVCFIPTHTYTCICTRTRTHYTHTTYVNIFTGCILWAGGGEVWVLPWRGGGSHVLQETGSGWGVAETFQHCCQGKPFLTQMLCPVCATVYIVSVCVLFAGCGQFGRLWVPQVTAATLEQNLQGIYIPQWMSLCSMP